MPGGGLSPDGDRWIGCKKSSFFLPVQVLSSRFRNLFLIYLKKAFEADRLGFHGEMAGLSKPATFATLCRRMKRIKWVVFAKPPFGGPEQVLKYLARYTHRVAISNRRLLAMEDGWVTFRWKDYTDKQTKVMKLDAVEFIRRFLLHILPSGFVHIRQFGFLANRARGKKLTLCRALLGALPAGAERPVSANVEHDRRQCPVCGIGHMVRVAIVPATCVPKLVPHQDSS